MLGLDEIVRREQEAGVLCGPWRQKQLLERAPWHVRRELEFARRYPTIVGTRQGLAAMDVNDFPPGAFAAIATTAAETSVVGNTAAIISQFCQIANNDARAGKVYEVRFAGVISNTATPTVIWTPLWGNSATMATNVVLGASPTATTVASISAQPVYGEFTFGVRTGGVGVTAATGVGHGFVEWGIPVTSNQYTQGVMMGGTSATIDTTGAGAAGCGLQIALTWGTSSASNTFTCAWYVLRSLN